MIRLGSALLDEPNEDNHIAMLIRQDAHKTWWALEGRPGGVGWRDATQYLAAGTTISNQNQPMSINQQIAAVQWMDKLINTSYDWDAIVGDGFRDLHLPVPPDPWALKTTNGVVHGDAVCSSSAIFAYVKAILAVPPYTDQAHTEPSDWVKFWLANKWT
jgi:hypothetical protein